MVLLEVHSLGDLYINCIQINNLIPKHFYCPFLSSRRILKAEMDLPALSNTNVARILSEMGL